MKHDYMSHLQYLRQMNITSGGAVSIFVPMDSSKFTPQKIFEALIQAADKLLAKAGLPSMNLNRDLLDEHLLNETKTLAIYYYNGKPIVIPLVTSMPPRVVVATSFHLKPLLASMDEHAESLLLHFDETGASLYRIDQRTEMLLCRFRPQVKGLKSTWALNLTADKLKGFLTEIYREIEKSINPNTKSVAVSGPVPREFVISSWSSSERVPTEIIDQDYNFEIIKKHIRRRLDQEVSDHRLKSVFEVMELPAGRDLSLEEIGVSLANRKLKHLCVSLEDIHFGELDFETGITKRNKLQLNAKDDDLLDDLVEMALDKGVKVSVVPNKFLPLGKTYLAS